MNSNFLKNKFALYFIALFFSVIIAMVLGYFIETLAADLDSAGGCPPNETCPPKTIPRAIPCCLGYCFKVVPSGYCILCAPVAE